MGFKDTATAKKAPAIGPETPQDAPGGLSPPQPATDAALLYDGSLSLQSRRYERMVGKVVDKGMAQVEAYIATSTKTVLRKNAVSSASKVFARPDVRARLEWLEAQKASKPLDSQSDEMVSLEDIGRQLSKVVRSGGMDSAFVSACTAALKIIQNVDEKKDAKLDPCQLASHLAQFAAKPGEQICREAGGLRFLLERFADICKISIADIHAASQDSATAIEVSH